MARTVNPLEQLIEECAEDYVDLVYELAEEIAPVRPWWHESLNPDQLLWRWMQTREDVIDWLVDVGPFLGWRTHQDLLDGLEEMFTAPIESIVPVELLTDPRADALKEMVQSAGPHETAMHIRKMERMMMHRAAYAAATTQPEPGIAIETMPVQPPGGRFDEIPGGDPFAPPPAI